MDLSHSNFCHNLDRGVYRSHEFRVVSEESRLKGNVVELLTRTIADSEGVKYSRDVVRHPGAVAVVAISESNEIYLVRQYRAPVDGCIWEIPAGKKDIPNEPDVLTAARELAEEAGLSASSLEPLIGIYQSAGFSDEFCQIFLATGLAEVPRALEGPEELAMELAKVPLDECLRMISTYKITDAKTVAGIYAAAEHLR